MNLYKKASLLVLSVALLFCSCAGESAASRSIIMAAPTQESPSTETQNGATSASDATQSTKEDVPMSLVSVASGLTNLYTGSENGGYTLASYSDSTADILYFDYTTLEMRALENTSKQDTSVLGGVENISGTLIPKYISDKLYLFHLGTSDASLGEKSQPSVIRFEPDGTSPLSCIFPSDWSFVSQSAVLMESSMLYFLMSQPLNDSLSTILVQLDTTTMTYEEVRRFEPGYEYSIKGHWEMGPLVQITTVLPPVDDPNFNAAWESRQFTLYAQGMYTGIGREVLTWTQSQSVSVHDNIIYMWDDAQLGVVRIDANTDEQRILAQGFAPNGYVQASINNTIVDNKLRIQFSTSNYLQDYTVDIETGEAQNVPLDNLGDNVTICAENSTYFLLSYGQAWADKNNIPYTIVPGMDDTATEGYASMLQYALISKQDYWNGMQNFTEFSDLVFNAKPRSNS